MTHTHRHFSWAPRLVPATVASLVSLFAIAPAETAINRLLHAPHPHVATTQDTGTAPEIVMTTHHGPHENPAMRLQRYAYKPHEPRDESRSDDCAAPCFDPDAFEPASGGVSGDSQGPHHHSGGDASPRDQGFDPPASPSQEAQFDAAGIGEFGHAGGSPAGGGRGGSGAPSGGGTGGGDDEGTSFVLLPGSGDPGGAVAPRGRSGGGGDAGDEESTPREENRDGTGGGAPAFSPSGGSGGGAGGDGDGDGDGDEPAIETISLRAAPPSGATEVSAPATATLFAAAVALLAWRRRAL